MRDSQSEYAITFDREDIDAVVEDLDLREHLRNNRRAYRDEGAAGLFRKWH